MVKITRELPMDASIPAAGCPGAIYTQTKKDSTSMRQQAVNSDFGDVGQL